MSLPHPLSPVMLLIVSVCGDVKRMFCRSSTQSPTVISIHKQDEVRVCLLGRLVIAMLSVYYSLFFDVISFCLVNVQTAPIQLRFGHGKFLVSMKIDGNYIQVY
jgi:hypothetical protein